MKYAKMLGLLAVAAAALMAFAGVASASTLTSPAGTTYTSTINASAGTTELHGLFTSVSCTGSTVSGKVEQHGAKNAGGKVSKLTFSGCSDPVTVGKTGSLEITSSGTVYSSGAEVEIETSVGLCVFTTSNTDVGTLTESDSSHGVLDIDSASIPRTDGSFFCGSSGEWTGSYTVTSPSTLSVH